MDIAHCIEKMYLEKIHVEYMLLSYKHVVAFVLSMKVNKYILKSFWKDMKNIFLLDAVWSTYMQNVVQPMKHGLLSRISPHVVMCYGMFYFLDNADNGFSQDALMCLYIM